MFKIKDVWDKIIKSAAIIRSLIGYILIIGFGFLVIRMFNSISEFINPDPVIQTEYHYEPIVIEPPDGDIGFLGKWKRREFLPLIWYDTVRYKEDEPVLHLMKYINADGKNITILTQYCNERWGKKIVYPYHERFELIATGNEKKPFVANRYIDYWDWEKLLVGISNERGLTAESRLHFLPFNVELDMIGSYKFFGEESEKRIETKLLWRVF